MERLAQLRDECDWGPISIRRIAASPTAGNPKNTTASMVHGEIATLRHTNGLTRVGGGAVSITSITNAVNGVVTTSAAHGFSTGDQINHVMGTVNNVLGTYNGPRVLPVF